MARIPAAELERLKEEIALVRLVESAGVELKSGFVTSDGVTGDVATGDIATDVDDQALLAQVIDFYHETLKDSPEALSYLEQRGLRAAGLIDHFKLGFANGTLGYRLPAKTRKAGAALRGQLQHICDGALLLIPGSIF